MGFFLIRVEQVEPKLIVNAHLFISERLQYRCHKVHQLGGAGALCNQADHVQDDVLAGLAVHTEHLAAI